MRPTIAFARQKPLHVAVIAPPWMELPPTAYGGIEAVARTSLRRSFAADTG